MKRPDQKAIDAEIATLKAMKPTVRERSGFGDDHHAAIDAQLDVLETRMSTDDIYDHGDEEKVGEEEVWADNVRDAAIEARQWLDGESKNAPSKEWKPLVK